MYEQIRVLFFLTRMLLQILTLLGFINISQSVMEAKVV